MIVDQQKPKDWGIKVGLSWKDCLKLAWCKLNWLSQIPVYVFCGYYIPFEDWRDHYMKE